MTDIGWIEGKSFKFIYASETYHIEIIDEESLKWTQLQGPHEGRSDTERYVGSVLSPDIVLLTWIEADGLGLSNALNIAEMTVTTHANMGRDVFRNPGTLEVISQG